MQEKQAPPAAAKQGQSESEVWWVQALESGAPVTVNCHCICTEEYFIFSAKNFLTVQDDITAFY